MHPHLQNLQREVTVKDASGLLAYKALRTCSKFIKSTCDAAQTSVFFRAHNQNRVKPHLRKNPHIHTVSIEYTQKYSPTNSSFNCLKNILPRVASLSILVNQQPNEHLIPTPVLDKSLLLWKITLQHLDLNNVSLLNSSSKASCSSRLGFLLQLPRLKSLILYNVSPRLTTADITRCTSLLRLTLQAKLPCAATSLDLSCNKLLRYLSCSGYSISSLNVFGLTALQLLDCSNNRMLKLDVSTNVALEELSCGKNFLKTLDVAMCPKLRVVLCSSNPLSSLHVHGCPLLEKLSCYRSKITELDLSSCVVLRELVCCSTGLKQLDVSPAAATLVKLVCNWCPSQMVLCHTSCSKLLDLSR